MARRKDFVARGRRIEEARNVCSNNGDSIMGCVLRGNLKENSLTTFEGLMRISVFFDFKRR